MINPLFYLPNKPWKFAKRKQTTVTAISFGLSALLHLG